MAKPLPIFVESLIDVLSPSGTVRVKRMFGAFGIYMNELFIGIVDSDVLYLKADDQTKAQFEAQDLKPFSIIHRGRQMTMSYYEVPEAALTSAIKIKPWVTLAVQAAQRSK